MDLTNIITLKQILKTYGAWPNKDLGQHFLTDKNVLERIVETAEISKDDLVIEVGPGVGILTKELCKNAKKVITIEVDPKMIEILVTTCIECRNIDIIRKDIKQFSAQGVGPYKLVANLPYYLTSYVLKKFLEEKNKPQTMTVLVQREVAERICAKPGRMSILSVAIQFYGAPELIELVSPTAFYPAPRVHSAILKIKVFKQPLFEDVIPNIFFRLVKAGFGEKRKMLENALSGGLGIEKSEAEKLIRMAGVEPMYRAERLSMEDWHRLYLVFNKKFNFTGVGYEANENKSEW